MSLVSLLVMLVILCLLVWATRAILAAFSIGPPISTLVQVALVVIIVLWLLSAFGLLSGGPTLRLR